MKSKHIVLLLLIGHCTYSQTLHAIIFADNGVSDNRQIDRNEDLKNLKKMMYDIAKYSELEINLIVNTGKNFTTSDVENTLGSLDVKTQDVIIFYFNGHGANEKNDRWPSISLNDNLYKLSTIHNRLCGLSAKLTISVGDCCNNFSNSSIKPLNGFSYNEDKLKKKFSDLFRSFSGSKNIIMSASSKGQYSYSDLIRGAIFGITFREVLFDLTQGDRYNWETVCAEAKKKTTSVQRNQIPDFNISSSSTEWSQLTLNARLRDPQLKAYYKITIGDKTDEYVLDRDQTIVIPILNDEKGSYKYSISARIEYYRYDLHNNKKTFLVKGSTSGTINVANGIEYDLDSELKGLDVKLSLNVR